MVVLANVVDVVVGGGEVVVVDIVVADVVVGNFVLSDAVVGVDVLSLHIFLRFIPNLPFSSYVYDRVKEEEEKKVNNLTIKTLPLN